MGSRYASDATVAVALVLLLGAGVGCSEFPCVAGRAESAELAGLEFAYDGPERVRYTYWFEDGAQRAVFHRDEVPETARAAVLIHVESKTSGELHGATGWVADIRPEEKTTAYVRPMAYARAIAHDSWAADWTAEWLSTRAGLLANAADAQRQMEENLAAVAEKGLSEPVTDPGQQAEPDEPDVAARVLPSRVKDGLSNKGISLDVVKRERALRVVGARQPLPRDFGLALEVEPVWLFVDTDCAACEAAIAWLDERGVDYHAMLVSDPTNANTLRKLAGDGGIDPVVPTAWFDTTLLHGFEVATWKDAFPMEKP